MKYLLSLLLIISFISLSVFGFVIFNQDMDHQKGGCLAATSDGVPCPVNTLDFILHHILALKIFSKSLISPIFTLAILMIVASLFSALVLFWRKALLYLELKFLPSKSPGLIPDHYSNQKKFISWLSLLELSPILQY